MSAVGAPVPAPRPLDRVRRLVARADPWLWWALALLGLALFVAAALALDRDRILAFSDSASHVVIARRVFDNRDIGLAQLGVHWTPLLQFLQIPLVAIGPLYRNGLSGTIVSAGAALLTAFFVYRMALLVGAKRLSAFLAVVLLIAAPSFLYVSVVPMHYALVMATTTGSIYFLTSWALTSRGGALVGAGVMLSLATLAHFDTWILWPLELGVVLMVAWRKGYHRQGAEATALLWGIAASYGVVVFLLMNLAIFGDPFQFLKSFQDTAGVNLVDDATASGGRGLGDLVTEAGQYPHAAIVLAGIPLVVGGALGALLYAWHWRRDLAHLVPLLLFYPLVFYVVWGVVAGSVISSGDEPETWTNLRYANTIFPALAFFLAVGIRWSLPRLALVATVVVTAGVAVASGHVAAWQEAGAKLEEEADLKSAAQWLAARAGDDPILIPFSDIGVDRFELYSGLPSDRFIDANDTDEVKLGRGTPASVDARWIVWLGWGYQRLVPPLLERSGLTSLCYSAGVRRVRVYAVVDPDAAPVNPGAPDAELCEAAGAGGGDLNAKGHGPELEGAFE